MLSRKLTYLRVCNMPTALSGSQFDFLWEICLWAGDKETNKDRFQSSRWRIRKMTRVGKERTNKIFGSTRDRANL